MAASIRAVFAADFPILEELFVRVRDELLRQRNHPPEAWAERYVFWQDFDPDQALIAEVEGSIGAFICWRSMGDSTAELGCFLIEPSLWTSGVNRELLGAASRTIRSAGFRIIHVSVIPEAVDFYRSCGFVRSGATATPLGPSLTMMKDLDAD